MKKHFRYLCVLLLVPWSSCTFTTTTPAPQPLSPATANAPMIVPEVPDTLLPSGRRNYYLTGNRNEKGFFIERSFFPAGYIGDPHLHSANMYITILKGNWHLAYGQVLDTTKGTTYGPGSFVVIEPDKPHYEWFTEDCLMQIEGTGPFNTFYSDKKDSLTATRK